MLALHLSRSIQYGGSGVKNTCRVFYPEYLDLTPFTTSGELSTLPSAPISTPPPDSPPSPSPSSSRTLSVTRLHSLPPPPPVLYRLTAVVCHYGTHQFGHYVAYRRKPKPPLDEYRWDPPRLKCARSCACDICLNTNTDITSQQQQQQEESTQPSLWLRSSDESVDEVGIERVLAEHSGAYMLYYERVVMPQHSTSLSSSISLADGWSITNGNKLSTAVWSGRNTPHSSEETITPANSAMHAKKEASPPLKPERLTPFEARIVHRVHAGRSNSRSGASTPLSEVSPSTPASASASTSTSRILANGDIHIPIPLRLPLEERKIPNGDSALMSPLSADLTRGRKGSSSSSLDEDSTCSLSSPSSHHQHHSTRTFLNEAGLPRTTGLQA